MTTLPPRDRTAVSVMLDAGLRASEACALRWRDIDLGGGLLRVQDGKGHRPRVVPLTRAHAAALARDRHPAATPADPVIHHLADHTRPIRRCRLMQIVNAIGPALGRHVHPHMLRHTYACQLLRAGLSLVDIQQCLGHSNVSTTAIYLHVEPMDLAARLRRALGDAQATALTLEV